MNTLLMFRVICFGIFLWFAGCVMPASAAKPDGWFAHDAGTIVLYSPDEDSPLARKLGKHGENSLRTISRRLGVDVGGDIEVFLPPTQKGFETLQPGRPPAWADATAYPERGEIYLRPPRVRGQGDEPLEVVLDHELVHILLGRAFQPNRPPAWLQEGTAQVLAGQYGPAAQRRQAGKVIGARSIQLRDLERSFPADPHQASGAYAISADFMAWLQQQYGPDVMRRIVDRARRGATFQRSVEIATQTPLDMLEKEWRATHARGSALWWSAVTSEEAVWAYMGMLAFIALIVARLRVARRTRRVIAEWREQEAWFSSLWPGSWGWEGDVEAMKGAMARDPDPSDPAAPLGALGLDTEDDDADLDDTDPFGDRP